MLLHYEAKLLDSETTLLASSTVDVQKGTHRGALIELRVQRIILGSNMPKLGARREPYVAAYGRICF